jgi:MFS family permease
MTSVTIEQPPAFPVQANLRRAFWGVMISFVLHGLVVSTWVSRIASVKTQLHLGDGALGLALLGTAIGSVAAIPVCGWMVGRYGSRRAVQWTGAGFCAALVLPALAWSEFSLFVALLFYGAMAGANDVAMNAQAVVTEKLRGTPTMSRFHAMFSAAGIAGASAGAFVASRGAPPLPHLAIGAALFAVLAVLGPRLMVDSHEVDTPVSMESGARAIFRRVPAALVALSAIGFCIFLSEGAIADWTGVYLKQVLGASAGMVPAGYAVFSAAMAIFRFAGDAITVRIGRASMIRAGGTLAAAGVALAISVHSTSWALVGFAAAGAGFSSIIPLVFAAGGRVKSVGAGAGVATVSGIGYLGFLVGPPAIGFISELSSLRFGLFLLVVLSAAAAMLVSVVERTSGADSNPLSDTV